MDEPIRTDRVRVLIFMKRKEGMTKNQFSIYWRDTHAKLFLSLNVVKNNVLRYEQAHTDDKWTSFPKTAMGLEAPDWDGVVILEGENFDKIFEVFGSEEYQRIVAPDEAKFLDRAKCQMLPVGIITMIA